MKRNKTTWYYKNGKVVSVKRSKVLRFIVVIIIAITLGGIAAHIQRVTADILPNEEMVEVTSTRLIQKVDPSAVEWIRKYNPDISEKKAGDMFQQIIDTIERYKKDPVYKKGATAEITPKLFLALVLRESGAKETARSRVGAIGLTQVMPLHVKTLHQAGVIPRPTVSELQKAKNNLNAGIHILMTYATNVQSIERALCIYNAGASRESAGKGYAQAVLRLYDEINGS